MINEKLDKRLRFYFELIAWPVLVIVSVSYYQHVNHIRKTINASGINSKAIVTDINFIKSSWSIDVRYSYKKKMYDASGYSTQKYAIGDSVRVRFSPKYPDEVFILDAVNIATP